MTLKILHDQIRAAKGCRVVIYLEDEENDGAQGLSLFGTGLLAGMPDRLFVQGAPSTARFTRLSVFSGTIPH
jgi:hypothetical protein